MDKRNHQERKAARRGKKALRRQRLDACRGKQFVRRTFATYPSLRTRQPDAGGWYTSYPYRGQEYDPEKFWVCEDGWDHEHCRGCWVAIVPGDDYWQSVEEHPRSLCLLCYERLTADSG
jgi:hypothetical protein